MFLKEIKKMVKRYDTEATVQDTVNELDGLFREAIYHHFQSREAIIDGVLRRLIQMYPFR